MTTNHDNLAIRPIHYLGSKLRLLESIKAAVDSVDPTEGAICDLFSGSGVVSEFMIQYRDVVSADIQKYSSILSEAAIVKLPDLVDADQIVDDIKQSSTTIKLNRCFSNLLAYEEAGLDRLLNGQLNSSYEIIEKGSIYIYMNEPIPDISKELSTVLADCICEMEKAGLDSSVDTMITRYFGGLYFSYRQAVELDAIASYAFSKDSLLKTKLTAALLSTASEIVNTVGKQFAQPLKVRTSKGELKPSLKEKIVHDRMLDTFSIFKDWLTYYIAAGTDEHSLSTLCMDYKDVLSTLKSKQVKVVYADPPYTRYHYSRYYHVLETICLRDNPSVTTTFPNGSGGISRAIYREGRHQSPFCIKSQAEQAFGQLFEGVRQLGVPLVLSYSPFDAAKAATPRLRSIDQLVEMASEYYNHVEIRSPGTFTHSKLNSTEKNFEANHEAELLIVCY